MFLVGCSSIERAAVNASNPTNILSSYATMAVAIALILFFFVQGQFTAILNALRIMGAICISTAPLFYILTENLKFTVAMGVSGILTLSLVTLFFWPTLYPKQNPQLSNKEKEDKKRA